ncbi:MAG: GAF domain-containing protein [Syntrophales bacterium]
MDKALRILMLEDNRADVELIQFELEEAGFDFTAKVVAKEEDFLSGLNGFCPDLILSDYDLPRYNGALALAEAKKRCPDVPFILVTGAITEDRAIDILTGGAKDYVMKNRLHRLAPALRRTLAEVEEQRARRKAEQELREAHKNLELEVEKRTAQLRAEIEERKRAEKALEKANRTLRALGRSNQALMRATQESAYLQEVCRLIVEDCGYTMVWIGYAEQNEERSVRPAAHAGFDESYLKTLRISWADTERGQGPTGRAIRTGKPCTCNVMETDPAFAPWREEARKRGYASSICLPLKSPHEEPIGAVNIYAETTDAFSKDEIQMLTELADDLTYGIENLRLRDARARTETRMQRQTALLAGINKIFWEALTSGSEEELGNVCLAVAEEITDSKAGFIGEINAEGLHSIAISNPGGDGRIVDRDGHASPPGNFEIHGIYGRVLTEGRGFFTNDPANHPDSIGVPPEHPPLHSFLGVPLMSNGGVIGMIGVGNREGGYTQEQLEALEALGPAVVGAFYRRRSEEEAASLGELLERAEQPFVIAYPDGRLGRFNRAFAELTGYRPEELTAMDWYQTLTPPESREGEQAVLKELERTGIPVRYEKEYLRKDGTRVPIELLVDLKRDKEGRPLYYYSFLTDLTARTRHRVQDSKRKPQTKG